MAEKRFKDMESLDMVKRTINEANALLNDKSRNIDNSAMSEVLAGALGAGVGGAASFGALFALGTAGLSAAGITSGLAAAGALVGGGMAAGVFVLAAPVAALAAGGVGIAAAVKAKKLKEAKQALLAEAIKKQNAILKAIENERGADKKRIDALTATNILLQSAIKDLKSDLA